MVKRIKAYTEAEYVEIGKRYGSEEVAAEVSLALARWERDLAVLAKYGYGQKTLDSFKALVASHADAMKTRPDGLAAKRDSVQGREGAVSGGWAWVDRVQSILGNLARDNASVANGLKEAVPADDSELPSGIGALALLLAANLAAIDPEADAAGLAAEAQGLVEALSTSPGAVKGSKEATKEDTRQVDLLDGKVAILIRDLNGAGRRAFRNLHDKVKVAEYKYHLLKHSGAASPPPEVPPAADPAP